MATRKEVRDYYRKSIGFMALINAMWLLCISGLAIYISDFGELSPETNAQISELLLYGYYTTFFIGAFMVVMLFVGGIVGLKSQSEGVFKYLMTVSGITAILAAIFTFSVGYTMWGAKIDWEDSYTVVIFIISLVLGILTLVYSVFTIVMAVLGRRYYDIGKKSAKEATDIKIDRLNVKFTGYTMITYILFALVVYFFSLYFKNDVIAYDKLYADDNTRYINLFNRVFIAGLVMSAIHVVMTVFVFAKGTKQIVYANKIVLMGQTAVAAFYVLVTATALGKNFSKNGYADSAYIIFSYIFIITNLIIAIRAFKMKVNE